MSKVKEAKHTPGPWRVTKLGMIEAGPRVIGDVLTGLDSAVDRVGSKAEQIANARLLAAAPDADRILRVLRDYLDGGFGTVSFDTLMPEDGYDGAADDQTLGTAILRYFAKAEDK